MQFKHPDFLYALFLLLIPIIVHFFQLRRFRKEAFTNVKILKKVELQTRRSSQLKKWLTLLARMVALAAIIIAFAQPFVPHSQDALKERETVVYIDNSFSMQQKGDQGPLLKQAVQQLLQSFPEDQQLTVLTNDEVYRNEEIGTIKNELLTLDYSPHSMGLKTAYLKGENLFSNKEGIQKQFIAISDFQEINMKPAPEFGSTTKVDLIPLKGRSALNFSIDSVFLTDAGTNASEINVQLKASQENEETLPVSLFNGDELIAKSSAGFDQDTVATVAFSLSLSLSDDESLLGRVEIEDNSLSFDNTAYFSLQKQEVIKVAALYQKESDLEYLQKLYQEPEFSLTTISIDALDYNLLENVNFIVLNELETLPNGLEEILEKHKENGGSLAIIPAQEGNIEQYNNLLGQFNMGQFSKLKGNELKITQIIFEHPLFTNVFDGKVDNFQYPNVTQSFSYRGNGSSVLRYNDGTDFIVEQDKNYLVTAPLNRENTNFKRSPLIVPVFYNMAKHSLKLPNLAYTLGQEHTIEIPERLNKDEVLKLRGKDDEFIPQQNRYNQKVEILLDELPEKAGTYEIIKGDGVVGHVSFNYDRKENRMVYSDFAGFEEIKHTDRITDFFLQERDKNKIDQLWKWFVLTAVFFLIIEVLLLKFLKQ